MNKAKIRLSSKENELVNNAEVILTKNAVLQKAKWLLEDVQREQETFLRANPGILPPEVLIIQPKISRGENYRGLPYLILDMPRHFEKGNHFAIRCLFWWGNYFSITLHLSGSYKEQYKNKIESALSDMKANNFFIGTSDDEWEHHIEEHNYRLLDEMGPEEFTFYADRNHFIKLVKKIPLQQWDDAADILVQSFGKIINWLKN